MRPDLGAPLLPQQWGLRAAWLYHGEFNAWTWSPSPIPFPHDLDRLNRLIAADYQQVPRTSINPSLMTLYGQMHEVLSLIPPGSGESERWASREAIERLQRVPVTLAFTMPDDIGDTLDAFAVEFETSTPEIPRKYLRMAQWLPPPQFGERALILRDGTWQTRTIAALGEDARALIARMGDKLFELAEPAGWRPWLPQLEQGRIQTEYEQRREYLRSELLRRHGEEREHTRTELELLDALRAHALDIQAQESRQIRDKEAWHASIAEVATMAQQLADLYWQMEQEAERRATRRAPPDIHNIFDGDGMTQVAAMMPVQTILDGYSAAAKGWERDTQGIPTYRQTTNEHDTAIQVRGEDPAELLDDTRIRQLWRQVGELSDLDGDVFLAMLAQEMASMHGPDGVWISAPQILDYRGVQPIMKRDEHGGSRRAGHRQEDLMEVAHCIGRQASQWVHINSMITEDVTGKRRKVRRSRVSKLTQIMEVVYQQELLSESDQGGILPIAWRYRIGTWLEPFLSGPNRKIAWLCQQTLGYDPYHETWEKRLARYFMFHLRINAKSGATISRRIGTLLENLSLSIDERNPERTRRRFEQALDRLVSDGVIDGWDYAKDNPTLPARKWIETWRTWSVYVHAGAVTIVRHAQITERARIRRERATVLSLKAESKKRGAKGRKGAQND